MNTKLKCLLLDDELPGLTYLKMLCQQIPNMEVVKAFDNPMVFLNEVSNLNFDFCILDIEMPEMSGLQIANILDGKPVLFATAYKEYAADAFDLHAIDYLRKPIQLERLKQAVEKVEKALNSTIGMDTKKYFQWNTNKGKSLLFFDKILYIRTSSEDPRDKIAHLMDGEICVLKNINFDTLSNILPSSQFCRVNKKELIAISAVQYFSHDEIATNLLQENGKNLLLTLSDSFRKDFLLKLSV